MKNRYLITRVVLTFAVILGIFSFGILGRAHAQVMPTSCTVLSYNLRIGQTDSSITALQTYLNSRGYLNHVPTGYFGGLTYTAVVNFQANAGLPATGFVGPLTRATIQSQSCGGVVVPPVPPITSSVTIESQNPTYGPVGTTIQIIGQGFTQNNRVNFGSGAIANLPSSAIVQTCTGYCAHAPEEVVNFTVPTSIGPYCAPGMMCAMYMQLITPGTYPISVTNSNGTSNTVTFTVSNGSNGSPLAITGIDAPNSIPLGTTGTWTVHVFGNSGTNLHYSVIWGDEGSGVGGFAAPSSSQINSAATFNHTYVRAGTYNPMFTVTDDFGHSVNTSASILVTPLY